MRVCINCSPSLPNQLLWWAHSSHHWDHMFLLKAHLLPTYQNSTATYLFDALQSNADWLSTGAACLGLCFSSGMLLLISGSAGRSAYLIALTTTVAACITTCVITSCISSVFVIFFAQSLSSFKVFSAEECFCLPSWGFYSWHPVMLLLT